MSVPKKFKVGDYVFAKMRGHPPWPAKIKTIKEKPMGKSFIELYDVYFFGTNERGTCTKNLIFPYSKEFKAKNTILKTKRYAHLYSQALKFMEEEIFYGVKEETEDNSMEVEKDIDAEQKEDKKIVEVRDESETCNVIDKEKVEKKEVALPQREVVIKLKRVDEIYTDLKSNLTIDLKTRKAVVIKSSPVIERPKDVYSMIDAVLKKLPTPTKKRRIIGRKLYTTTKDSPCIIQNVCTVDEEFFKNSSDSSSFVEEKAMELFDPKGYHKTTDSLDYWSFGESQTSKSPKGSMKVNAILLKSTNTDNPKQYLMMQKEHSVSGVMPAVVGKQHQMSGMILSPTKVPSRVEHPISGVVTTNGVSEIRPKKKRIKITKPRPRTINRSYNHTKLRKYVPFMKHNDHDYPKIRGKVLMTDDEAREYFTNFEPMEEDKDESDPLDISAIQNEVLSDPNVDLNIFGPEVVIKDEPSESPKKKRVKKDKIDYHDLNQQNFKCLKCERTFTKHSFERHKCGTLKIDNIAGIADINTTLKHVISQQNWQNRKIVFTCSVCQKLCNNVNELADHLNAVHSQKPNQPKDPLAFDNEAEPKKDVKVMVCNVLTPIKDPPVNPKAVIKINSNSNKILPINSSNNKLVPIAPRIENSAGNPVPLFVHNDQGKSFLLVPENNNKLDIKNAIPALTPIQKHSNISVTQNTELNGWVMVNGKPMKQVYLNNEEVPVTINNPPIIHNPGYNGYALANGKHVKGVTVNNGKLPAKSVTQPTIQNTETNSWVMVNGKPMKTVCLNNGQLTEIKKNETKTDDIPAMIQSTDFNQWLMVDGKAMKVVAAQEKLNKAKGMESDTSGTVTASDDDEVKFIKVEPPDEDAPVNDFKPILLRERLLSK